MKWIQAVDRLTQGQIVAADGKTLRRSHDRSEGKKALQMVSAWASTNGVVLGQSNPKGQWRRKLRRAPSNRSQSATAGKNIQSEPQSQA